MAKTSTRQNKGDNIPIQKKREQRKRTKTKYYEREREREKETVRKYWDNREA